MDIFVVRKGVPISINASGVAQQYRRQVTKSLEQQIEKIGCRVSPNADVSVVAKITGPKKTRVSYFRAGDFDFNEYTSVIEFVFNGKVLWSSRRTNQPGFLKSARDKSYKQQLADAGAKPNLGYFSSATLPEYLQKPSGNGKNTRVQQTLGASSIADAKL